MNALLYEGLIFLENQGWECLVEQSRMLSVVIEKSWWAMGVHIRGTLLACGESKNAVWQEISERREIWMKSKF